jgi:hypothetical protein
MSVNKMFNFLGTGWEAVAPVPALDSSSSNGIHNNNNNNNTRRVAPILSSPTQDENDDAVAKEILVQFPVYGTRSQAQSSSCKTYFLNPS